MNNHPLLTKTSLAIVAITTIVIICIFKNIDGALIGVGIATIAGLAGFVVGKGKKQKGGSTTKFNEP